MKRTCEAEILDSLAEGDPEAVRSRRDLLLINRVMGNAAWFERVLPPLLRPGERVLELGAGTGELGLRLGSLGIPVDGLDLWGRPAAWDPAQAWHKADLRTFGGYGTYPVVIGNLILHQFGAADLARLGRDLRASARVVVACEPARRRLSQALVGAIGPILRASPVTLHDARVSISAGFLHGELPGALGLDDGGWSCSCRTTAIGAYRMVAVRRR
jgi:hypothetical protein